MGLTRKKEKCTVGVTYIYNRIFGIILYTVDYQWGVILQGSPLRKLAAMMGLGIILILFVGELMVLSQHLDDDAQPVSGTILKSMSIDKSQFVSHEDPVRYTVLTRTLHTITFTLKLSNQTRLGIYGGTITINFQGLGDYYTDPIVANFDLNSGETRSMTFTWQPTIEQDETSWRVMVNVSDKTNDDLGSLSEPLILH